MIMKEKIIEKLILVYNAGVTVGVMKGKKAISEEATNIEAMVCNIIADNIIKLYEDKEEEE